MTLLSPTLLVLPALVSSQETPPVFPEDGSLYEMPAGKTTAVVPLRWVANQVRLDAMVNGRGPFQLILDTGMPAPGILLFRSERVDALRLGDTGGRAPLAGAGGSGQSYEAVVGSEVSLTLGELKLSKVSAMVLKERSGLPPSVDGIIGGALFFRFVVVLDVDRGRLELTEPKSWSPPADACVVPLHLVQGSAFVPVRIAVGSAEPIAAEVVVDLGAGHAVSLNTRASGALAPPAAAIDAPLGRGLSGVVNGRVGRVRRLEIGSFAFDQVIASFPVAEHRNPGGFDFRDGNLGAGILKRFKVGFDYASRRMVLEKGARFADPFEFDMSGIALDWRGDGTVSIRSVLPGSPAATAGVEPGDRLLEIDGRRLDDVGEDGIGRALRVDGAEVVLKVGRGVEALVKRVRLRRLV
ncbi:MAG: aspartyl protease family protein [Planctomycetes bacterium]|nr:aspartyl protease family protein [Planctomycetota bacterium]